MTDQTITGQASSQYINSGTAIGTLTNNGTITGFTAIRNQGTIGSLVNNGVITGSGTAIYNMGTIGSLTNSGTISSGLAIYSAGTILGTLNNSGLISGNLYVNQPTLTIAGGTGGTTGTITSGNFQIGSGNGTLILASGSELLNQTAHYGATTIEAGATLAIGGTADIGNGTVSFAGTNATLAFKAAPASGSTFADTLNGFTTTGTIDLLNVGFVTGATATVSGTSLTLTDGTTTEHFTLSSAPAAGTPFYVSADGHGGTNLSAVLCYRRGTRILTADGEVAVEHLRPGDLVMTLHNGARPVSWVGRGRALAPGGRRTAATPVIVRKGALGNDLPHTDLHVTKAHALYIDDVLIPAEFLVNHSSIVWDDRAQEVELYHVELDSHDVLISNGAPTESYRDDGNRWLFQNADESRPMAAQAPYRPVLTGGPVVDAAWRRLLDLCGGRPLPPLTEEPDLHLLVDGRRVDAAARKGDQVTFHVSGGATSLRIASRAASPAELGLLREPRHLGVALRRVELQRGARLAVIDAGDDRLADGFHDYEPALGIRWTNGDAILPAVVLAGFQGGGITVTLTLGGTTRYPAASTWSIAA
ncbi:MAG: hypothetical protein B7Z80_09165 [Rhodospirillales bacterium 20-64-7]|nr:MAG: hypothetical protein B7Z80_09165 [Rhodospirillales bacterium 20-64-7]HQT77741.1 Hint domain-containing protein [Rhodopila sp.]